MNANELANFIRDISEYTEFNGRHYCQQCFKEAQDMLLQQQAEIEALKNRNWDLVSEPWGFDRHPAKTLTDEEILVFQDADGNELKVDTTKWKLRKAQEK